MPSRSTRVCNSYAISGRTKSSASAAGRSRLRPAKLGFRPCHLRKPPCIPRTHRRPLSIGGPRQNPCCTRLDKKQRISKIVFPKSGSNSVVECDLAKVEVASSNLVSRSRNLRRKPASGAHRDSDRGFHAPLRCVRVARTSRRARRPDQQPLGEQGKLY